MKSQRARRTQLNRGLWAAFIAGSLLLNASAMVAFNEIGFSGVLVYRAMVEPEVEETETSLVNYSCQLDAALASSAQMIGCAASVSGDRFSCYRDTVKSQQLAYLKCVRDPEPVTVAMIDISKIKPMPILPVEPVDDIVAAQLIEQQVVEQIEQAQQQVQQQQPMPPVSGQVVEITQPQLESRPDRARFLSEYDSQVKEEVVARGSTEEMVDRPAPKEIPVAPDPPDLPEEKAPESKTEEATADIQDNATDNPGREGDGREKSVLAMRGVGSADRRPSEAREAGDIDARKEEISSEGIDRRRGDGDRRSEKSELEPEGGGGGDGGKTRRVPDLKPSKETMARAVGGGSVDKLDNVKSGDFTALNSRKWKYASFFNRLKRRVAQNWHPDKVYLRRDPTGKVYGQKDRITVLRVSLKPDGSLAKVFVAKQSGVDFLDDEAVRAFNEAGPFPNPPQALVENGLITFSFGFHFQIGGRRDSWKIFRYR